MRTRTYKHHYRFELDVEKKPLHWALATLSIGLTALLGLAVYRWATSSSVHYINPASDITPTPTPEPVIEAKLEAKKSGTLLEGAATWYGVGADECLGCNPERIMANGQKLDDTAFTVACNDFPLGTRLIVQNVREDGGGLFTEVVVTDRHGSNIVVDMTKAVRDRIGCGGKCWVRVWPVAEELVNKLRKQI